MGKHCYFHYSLLIIFYIPPEGLPSTPETFQSGAEALPNGKIILMCETSKIIPICRSGEMIKIPLKNSFNKKQIGAQLSMTSFIILLCLHISLLFLPLPHLYLFYNFIYSWVLIPKRRRERKREWESGRNKRRYMGGMRWERNSRRNYAREKNEQHAVTNWEIHHVHL